jgi:AraC-like DNA-binding protein
MYFVLKGEVWINSAEHLDIILREGDFVIQPVGSTMEFRIHTPAESIIYMFDRLQNVCDLRFNDHMDYVVTESLPSNIMHVCEPLRLFLVGIKAALNDGMVCAEYMRAKQTELFCLLNCYYTLKELSAFYAPVYSNSLNFRYFVMSHYHLAKDVSSFARLGGYSISTFRRLFKDTFNEPVYQWMMKQKCRSIYEDITTTSTSITAISIKYGFESLANFSHFCRTNFGKSPRGLRSR